MRLGIDVDGQVDRFKEDCILSVVVLHVLWCLLRVLDDRHQTVLQHILDLLVLWGRIVLKQPQKLDLKPRYWDLVIDVV